LNLRKNKLIILSIIFLFCLTMFINIDYNLFSTDIQEETQLKLSAPNFNLLHQYDFEAETLGQDPSGVTLVVNEPSGCTANIETLGDGQQNHVALYKSGSVGRVMLRDNISYYGDNHEEGELHFKFYHDTSLFGIWLIDSGGILFRIDFWSGNVGQWAISNIITSYTSNQWTNITIYYNISRGWMFDIDSVRYGGDYTYGFEHGSPSGITHIEWVSAVSAGGNGYFRVDDIAFYYETASLINIVTPENKTYFEPMSGYYPATYGFENVEDGALPTDWSFNWDGTSYVEVDDTKDGHNKVLHVRKIDDGTQYSGGTKIFENNATAGTVEFWLYKDTNGGTDATKIDVKGESGDVRLLIENQDLFQGHYGSRVLLAADVFTINKWYHIRIDFNLSQGGWQVQLDNTWYGSGYTIPFTGTPTEFWGFGIGSHWSGCNNNYGSWLDALGYSWDPNYNIGDNLNEGLLLSFENSTTLDWIEYSLDGQMNKTILGNTTIPIPEEGVHTIQVFGNDTLGIIYESDIRTFTVDFPIDIITPEAKSYTKPMDGYYPATYGFEDVLDDTTPTYVEYDTFGSIPDWVNSYTRVINNKIDGAGNKHNKVLLLKDGTSSGLALSNFNFTESDSEIARNSTIEFYHLLNIPGTHYISRIALYGKHGGLFQIFFETNSLVIKYINGSGTYSTGFNLVRDRWYRYSIDMSCDGGYAGLSANQFRFRIYDDNGILIYTSYDMGFQTPHPTGGPNRISMISSETQTQEYQYMDAFSITGLQDNYEIGDNMNEGLLLSYENSTALNVTGYSLDYQAIEAISGNTTIPMPEDGIHTIQVFSNDSLGIMYESTIRHFSVYSISIITPENKTYTTPMSGYYPATFGFEETNTNSLPSYCDYAPGGSSPDGPGSYSKVIDSWTDGGGNIHKKVLKTYDRTGGGTAHSSLNFTNEGSITCRNSTIEFWACNTQTGLYYHSYFEIWGDLGNMVSFEWESGGTTNDPEIRITPSSGEFGTGVYQEWNKWYRYSIDISCDGGYAGLSANQFRFRIYNDINDLIYSSADLGLLTSHPTGGPYRYHVLSTQSQADVSHYLDGFSVTGLQDNYIIGDNLNEGLLLSYENQTALDWQGYSLDKKPITTIMGNNTILLPDVGQHTIQIFANDSLGLNYFSDIRYFTIDTVIHIITPENKTYTTPMSGYYPATFGFEETITDILPSYCDYAPGGTSPDGPGSYARVIDSWTDGAGNTHKKILKTYDRTSSSTAHSWINFTNEGSESCRNSTIEFWACNTQTGVFYHTYFEIHGDLGNMVQFEWDSYGSTNDPEIRVTPATGEFGTGVYHEWNRWYRYSIDISCDGGYAGLGANQFRFRIYDDNGVSIYNSSDLDLKTAHPTGGPYRYHVLSTQSQSDVSHYLDGFSITGLQDNYVIADNLNEGLLLSFENSTVLDWIGYSSDGLTIRKILGNTTIPMPSEGIHTIQMFGDDSFSPIRYFTVNKTLIIVDLIAPVITINFPVLNTLFGSDPPPFNLTIIETNLNSMWYTLDGGFVNTTITEPTGTIGLSIWFSRPNGTVNIRFYADDIAGNVGFEEVEVKKDILPPQIIINTPSQNQIFYDLAPNFDLTIIEGNLDKIWYTLDDGTIIWMINQVSGSVNNIYWSAIPPGDYTLRFYANDTLGQESSNQVIVKKKEQDISSYDTFIISLIIFLGFMGISWKVKKKSK